MTESAISKKIQLAMQDIGVTLWRNNVGVARMDGRTIRYGLAVGSSDLVGCDMEGTFVCVEVKTARGRIRERQEIWRDEINQRRGIAIVARSADEAVAEYRRLKAARTCGDPATIRPLLKRATGGSKPTDGTEKKPPYACDDSKPTEQKRRIMLEMKVDGAVADAIRKKLDKTPWAMDDAIMSMLEDQP